MHKSIHYLTLLCCIANSTVVFSSEAAKQVPRRKVVPWKREDDPGYQEQLRLRKQEDYRRIGKQRASLETGQYSMSQEMVELENYKAIQKSLIDKQREFYKMVNKIVLEQLGSLSHAPQDCAEKMSLFAWMKDQRDCLKSQEAAHDQAERVIDKRLQRLDKKRRALQQKVHKINTGYQWKSKP